MVVCCVLCAQEREAAPPSRYAPRTHQKATPATPTHTAFPSLSRSLSLSLSHATPTQTQNTKPNSYPERTRAYLAAYDGHPYDNADLLRYDALDKSKGEAFNVLSMNRQELVRLLVVCFGCV